MGPSAGEAEKPSTRAGTLSCFAVSSRRKIRCGYAVGEKMGEQAPADAKLPYPADLNMMAQRYFKEQGGGGNQGDWDLGFENGYEAGFKKTHK